MHNCEHFDLAAVSVDLVDDNVRIFDQFARSRLEAGPSHVCEAV
jgi:hypothetical protein